MRTVKYYAYIKNSKVLDDYMQFHCYLQQCKKHAYMENRDIFDVSKIDLPLQKSKIGLFATKNDFKMCQVSLPFRV